MAFADGENVVLGGHSLGGAMAARFALRRPEAVTGLVFLGAFSAKGDDLSALPLDVLVLAAEHDGLATLEEVRAGLTRLPDTAQLTILEGSVHSFLGATGHNAATACRPQPAPPPNVGLWRLWARSYSKLSSWKSPRFARKQPRTPSC